MLSNTAKLLKALLAILLPSARANASVYKAVKLIIGLLKAAGKVHPIVRPMSAPKAVPAITYVASLSATRNDDDQRPASTSALEDERDLDVSLPAETEEEAFVEMAGFGQLSTMSAHWDLASMAKCDDEEDVDTSAELPSTNKAISDHALSAIPQVDKEAANTGAGKEKYVDLMVYRRRRLDVIEEVDEDEYDEDDITPGIPAGGLEECTDSLHEASSTLMGAQEHGQLVSASAHWDLASLLQCGEDNDGEEEPCVEAHVIADLPSSPAARSFRRLSTIMEADDEADDEANSDDERYSVSSERDEDELDAPFPSIFLTTPSSKTIAHRAFPAGGESTVADMSGLAPSTDPPCSPNPSECSSVDSPMPLTPSTDFKFDDFHFPTMVSSPRMDDGFPTADRLFEGIPSSISFSKLIASPASDEESPASLVIRTADCLFQGIPSLGSYETLYLKSNDPPVPEINAPPPRTSSIINPSISHGPCIPLSAAHVTSTSTAGDGGYLYDGLILGWLAFWLRISVLLSFLFRFFSIS